jgi:hypothetical protein
MVMMLFLLVDDPRRPTREDLRDGLSYLWPWIAVTAAGIAALLFDGSIAMVVGVLFIALRKELVRLEMDHARWVRRMNPSERWVKPAEVLMVLFGLVSVGIGALTLAAKFR